MAKKILVIDDEELITKSLLKLLSQQGYSVIVAKSGKEALEKVKSADFDLIISDIRMPELNGIEMVRNIRKYLGSVHKNLIPEILITGYADIDKYEEARELKVADYLNKPFDSQDLLQVIKRTIG